MALSSVSFLIVRPANAQTIPKPSTPEFTISLADHSYDVPPVTTSTINPYNNKTETTTTSGYHIQNITIDVTIKNQAFPPVINGNSTQLYYDIQIKGHYGEEWTDVYHYMYSGKVLPVQSSSQYTVISLPANYQPEDEVDIQVRAILGYTVDYPPVAHSPIIGQYTYSSKFFNSASNWSTTQTIKIGEEVPISPTPTAPEFSWFAILPLFLSMFFAAILIRQRKTVNTTGQK
jgi:hypothetical protein